MGEETFPRSAPDLSGPVQSMMFETAGRFVFTLLVDGRTETVEADASGGTGAAVTALVSAAYVAKVPLDVGLLPGPSPRTLAWLQIARPANGRRRPAAARGLRPEELNASNDA